MKLAFDFWKSKTLLFAVGTTLGIGGECLLHQKWPDHIQTLTLLGAWFAVFKRDADMKGAEIKAGVRDPVSKEPLVTVK